MDRRSGKQVSSRSALPLPQQRLSVATHSLASATAHSPPTTETLALGTVFEAVGFALGGQRWLPPRNPLRDLGTAGIRTRVKGMGFAVCVVYFQP
jgi:hypothetical protein